MCALLPQRRSTPGHGMCARGVALVADLPGEDGGVVSVLPPVHGVRASHNRGHLPQTRAVCNGAMQHALLLETRAEERQTCLSTASPLTRRNERHHSRAHMSVLRLGHFAQQLGSGSTSSDAAPSSCRPPQSQGLCRSSRCRCRVPSSGPRTTGCRCTPASMQQGVMSSSSRGACVHASACHYREGLLRCTDRERPECHPAMCKHRPLMQGRRCCPAKTKR